MRYQSTRNAALQAGLSQAIARGLAADGGLYVPESLPRASLEDLETASDLPELAARLLAPFAE